MAKSCLLRLAIALVLVGCSKSGDSGGTGDASRPGSGGRSGGMGGSGPSTGGATGGSSGSSSPGGPSGSGAMGGGATGGATAPPGQDAPGAGGSGPPSGGIGSASVLERNGNPTRDGHFVQPSLTKANAAKMTLDAGFAPALMGNMWASPLFVENGPGGKGVFFAVTNQNNVYALDETTGAVVWMKNVGTPAGANGPNARCGNIHPLGILATPVIDADARTIFLSAAVGDATAIQRHEVHALSVDTGEERPGWPVNVSGKLGFDPQPHNPRSALSLVKGIVYIAYGGHVGDCGNYHGRVVAIDSKDPTKVAGWATGGTGEAIWAPGGMASDGNAIYATTGNRTGGAGAHQDSEEVVRISGMATVNRASDIFYPAVWQQMDGGDADFGSSSPLVIKVPGATPETMVVATAKTGHVYFVDPQKMTGMGGELADLAAGTGGFTAPTSYQSSKGTFVALTLSNAACPMGNGQVAGILVAPGAPAKPAVAWCAPSTGRYSPISTTTDGKSEALVWFMNGTKLNAVDGETGQVVFNGGMGECAGVIKWTSPIAVKGRIVVGAANRLCSWSVGQ
jgi:hypothetical protein